MQARNARPTGFTVIEAAIALAILALLVGVAAPACRGAVSAVHSGEAEADLFDTLNAALLHASTAQAEVVVCPTLDGGSCRPGNDWTAGWIAFADLDGNRERDTGDTLLRRHGPIGGDTHLRSNAGRPRIVFQPTGGAAAGYNTTFVLCDGRGAGKATALVLANSGRLRHAAPSPAAALACLQGG